MLRPAAVVAVLLLLVPLGSAVSADEPSAGARAKRMPPPAANLITVAKVVTGKCSTDGGGVKCAPGVKFLGEILAPKLNEVLASARFPCDTVGTVTLKMGFSYNDGAFVVLDSDKAQARWQRCVGQFAEKMKPLLKTWYDQVHALDPTMDMNSEYKITLKIVKTEGAGLDL